MFASFGANGGERWPEYYATLAMRASIKFVDDYWLLASENRG